MLPAFLSRCFCPFFAERGAGFLWQMSNRLFPFCGSRSLLDVLPGGGPLFRRSHGAVEGDSVPGGFALLFVVLERRLKTGEDLGGGFE